MTTRAPAVLKFIIPKRTKYEYEILGGYLCFHFFGRNFGIFLAHQKYRCSGGNGIKKLFEEKKLKKENKKKETCHHGGTKKQTKER